ncbi:type II toxin-antitoxin system RelE/ParE family toxin [Serratia ureilytica]|uniref:type II toxin-antitoxin system RelE/ParE family toxin n=1 Tax=Serratia ureilytica TaxID=300181 RepID=UPI001D185F05|nr:type II toxin-antitoxin system RelE/ParE family toxin [Serratia ureilytica]MCC4107229.1 type II toxin-antitoxin system RelE/ParE family toxin [Serratia ureilytica]
MDIFVTDDFDKFMKKNRIVDQKICTAAHELEHGNHDGDLGGGVYKKRLPLNRGKRGGTRSIVAFKHGRHQYFVDGWLKNTVKQNGAKEINDDELATYRELAKDFLAMPPEIIKRAIDSGYLREVKCDD